MKKEVQWKIGGEAGYGIMTSGLIFSRVCVRTGFNVFDYIEYPSLIRGGHNAYQIRISEEEIFSQVKPINLLVALNLETVDRHKEELTNDAIILYDEAVFQPKIDKNLFSIPWTKIVNELGLESVMINNVALGASVAIANLDLQLLLDVISDMFGHKGEKVVDENHKAAKAGYDFVKEHFKYDFPKLKIKESNKIILTGNEATALGAIAGGCQCYFAYPMTPSTSILYFMAEHAPNYGIIVKQPEDEISTVNMAIGAGFAGARSMCATSGGGFCLMAEANGLAAETETPVVIVDSQRPGPGTSLPTWTEQGDLRLVLSAGQGEFPRFVLAPGDVDEAFCMAADALNIAEKYQTPVIILLDKYLSESHKSTNKFDFSKVKIERGNLAKISDDYKRYAFTESGISPRALPGQLVFRANSDEHDEHGFSNEEIDNRVKMADKRMRKAQEYLKEMPAPKLYGNENAKFTIVGWGSTKGPVLEALKSLPDVNFLHFSYLSPFPVNKFKELTENKNLLFLENNQTGLFADYVRQHTGFEVKKFLKYNGRPFYPEEIIEKVKNG